MNYTIDIPKYLAEKLPGHFTPDSRGWLIGSCLFHADGKRPNLGVRPESGRFRCLSCGAHGDFIDLVRRIERFETRDDAEIYLESRYGVTADVQEIRFHLGAESPQLSVARTEPAWEPPNESLLLRFKRPHPYLYEKRGITAEWQRFFEVGFWRGAVTFPWRDVDGTLITVKFRSVHDKKFWYYPRVPGGRKNTLVYGLYYATQRKLTSLWICESEIDAISLWQSGRPAVAIGGNQLSPAQARKLALAGVQELTLACDRDAGGNVAHELIRKLTQPYGIRCVEAKWDGAKDCNELLVSGRIDSIVTAKKFGFSMGI